MAHDRHTNGKCPHCNAAEVVCSYNHFEREALTIDAWEHKCPNCGFRDTKAFRSDEPQATEQAVDPTICPYCQRRPAAS